MDRMPAKKKQKLTPFDENQWVQELLGQYTAQCTSENQEKSPDNATNALLADSHGVCSEDISQPQNVMLTSKPADELKCNNIGCKKKASTECTKK